MQISNLIIRYASYLLGLIFTVVNIFLVTYYLDVNEFAVWGISLSLIYVFSQLSQLTFVQLIEKYFATYTKDVISAKLYQIIKFVVYISPTWFVVLSLLENIDFFTKYKIENIYILFFLITVSAVFESLIEIFSKFMLVSNKSKNIDIGELLILKFIRTISFFILLHFGYSIFHLLSISILLRGMFLILLFKSSEKNLINFVIKVLNSKINIKLFDKFKYTIFAFLIKSLQVSFLNIAFLIYTDIKGENIASVALGVIIINNLRPIASSLTSLIFPSISLMANRNRVEDNFLISSTYITTIISSFLIVGVLILIEFKGLYSMYLEKYDNSIYKLIPFAVFAATINPIFQPVFLYLKFVGKELYQLLNVSIAFMISLLFVTFTDIGLIICYLIFEMFTLIITTLSYKKMNTTTKIYLISISYLITSSFLLVEFYGYNLDHRPLIFTLPLYYFADYLLYKSNKEKIKSVFKFNLDKN